MAEEEKKPSQAEKRYGDKKPEKKSEEKPSEKKPEGEKDDRGSRVDAMRKRHETEHRDLHGTHRDAMRKMFDRHSQEYSSEMAAPGGEQAPAGGGNGPAAPEGPEGAGQ
jgi:hypothetical protein